MNTPTENRRCGPCTACCTLLDVNAIEKPAGERCKFLAMRGCGIYKARPPACETFRCGWLQGIGANQDRPDLMGVMLRGEADGERIIKATGGVPTDGGALIVAEEVYADHFTRARWRTLRDGLVRSGLTILEIRREDKMGIAYGKARPEGVVIGIKPVEGD